MQNKQDFMKTKPVFPLLLSMAAPMVPGAAARLYSYVSGLAVTEIKGRILNSVRRLDSLSGKTSTGGMLDVSAALNLSGNN